MVFDEIQTRIKRLKPIVQCSPKPLNQTWHKLRMSNYKRFIFLRMKGPLQASI